MNDPIDDDFSSIGIPPSATSANSKSNAAASARQAQDPDRQNGSTAGQVKPSGVVQPKPQALPRRTGPSSIIVSPRQKGNPLLNHIKSLPWEYGDIPADFVLGLTTCALFLQLKYHKLHPEYVYNRIKQLQGKYNLRIVLVLVDIENHEESLKELTKTSLINNVTLILCWSAAEGGRYLELFKTYENAAPTSIKQHQSNTYSDRMVDFITTPRSINKTDAISLVSQFGTIRTAVNARHEDVAGIAGWGEKKVERWCRAVREPFRVKKAAKRGLDREQSSMQSGEPGSRAPTLSRDATRAGSASPLRSTTPHSTNSSRLVIGANEGPSDAEKRPRSRLAEELPVDDLFGEDDAVAAEALVAPPILPAPNAEPPPKKRRNEDDDMLSGGVMAALSKLRKNG